MKEKTEKVEVKSAHTEDKQGVLDRALNKAVSRKLMVFAIATGFFMTQRLTEDYWISLALVYIGSEALANIFRIAKTGK